MNENTYNQIERLILISCAVTAATQLFFVVHALGRIALALETIAAK